MSNKQIAAFFDIDGTIYREGLIIEVFKKMINYEMVDQDRWFSEVKPAFDAWDKRLGDYDNYLGKIVDIFIETIKGESQIHMDWIAKNVVKQKGDRVYQFSRSRIDYHRDHGHKIIAISGSPIELVKGMAGKYGFDDYRGTVYKVDEEGRYTGEIIPMWDNKSKEKALLELQKEYDIDLDNSYSYGDTNGDLTMFGLTGHPYAINPSKELLNHIKESPELSSKVNVVVERKDVIYHLNIKSLLYE